MFNPDYMQTYQQWINNCNQRDLQAFVPFYVDKHIVGYIGRHNLDLFAAQADVFQLKTNAVYLKETLDTPDKRTTALDRVCRIWRDADVFFGWRDEPYKVAIDFNAPALFLLERAATALFGVCKYGVHLNGYTVDSGEKKMWVGRRSRHSPTYPSQLDHIVAGGLGAGYGALDALIKEAAEEADIPKTLSQQAKPVGIVSYCHERNHCLNRDTLFIYDLHMPTDFVPRNTDGEVEDFYLWSLDKVMETVANTTEAHTENFKKNDNLVLIDFFMRHGYIPADAPLYTTVCQGLKQTIERI